MTTKRKAKPKCQECGSTKDVIDGMCEACEEYHVWCDVCKVWHSTEGDTCRHVFWTEWGWAGAGSRESDWDDWKWPFFAFLDLMASIEDPEIDGYPDLVTGIEAEITKHAFWTRLEGPMLGTPDLRFYRLRPDLHPSVGSLGFARITASEIYGEDEDDSDWDDDDDGDPDDSVSDGFAWLQSLCADETPEANERTLGWIGEWRALEHAGWRSGRRF